MNGKICEAREQLSYNKKNKTIYNTSVWKGAEIKSL